MKTEANKLLNSLITDETPKKTLDIISFIKKCIKEYPDEKESPKEQYIEKLFEKFYGLYARKGAKIQALKTFKKKLIKLKTEEQILEKVRKMGKLYIGCEKDWKYRRVEKQYIPLCSSWISKNIPD